MKKRYLFPLNEMDLKCSETVIFSNQYKALEIRKCYSMALMFAYNMLQIVCALAHKPILESVLKLIMTFFFLTKHFKLSRRIFSKSDLRASVHRIALPDF